MSIAYFPAIYPDELIYSVLARFYIHNGFMFYKDAAQELYKNQKIKPDKEFVKNLKPEVVKLLTKHMTLEELLEKHTMYPYYGRFIDSNRRNSAYEALEEMNGDFSKLFGVPNLKKGQQRFFRYCPMCAQADRERYGETYWHRLHQMRNVNICSVHNCYLIDSGVSLDSRVSVNLVTAEAVILPKSEIRFCNKPLELRLAEYNAKVFLQPIDRNNIVQISDFFHSKLAGTPYISSRGEHNYFHKLWEELQKFYQGITGVEAISDGQIQRLLGGGRAIFYEICMVAMFLNISAEELAKMEVPIKSPEQLFDERVKLLLDSGMGINAVAKEMGVASSVIRLSVDVTGKSKKKRKYQIERKGLDWEKLDKENLPLVKKTLDELQSIGEQRPCKISMYAVSKRMNIASYGLQRMELCRKEIEKRSESREEYLVRKVKWAIKTLEREGKAVKCWRICGLAKIEKDNLIACLPQLEKMAESEVVNLVKAAL